MTEFNTDSMNDISDKIIDVLTLCMANKTTWKNNKQEMIKLIEVNFPEFYEKYTRICRMLVNGNEIGPLIGMIKTFGKVQNGNLNIDSANDLITSNLNKKYIDSVLDSEELVKERNTKMQQEKIQNI
jgi:hypothetical protein